MAQSFYGVLGLLIYLSVCLRYQPYANPTDDLLFSVCMLALFLVVFFGFCLKLGRDSMVEIPGSSHLGWVLTILSIMPWVVVVWARGVGPIPHSYPSFLSLIPIPLGPWRRSQPDGCVALNGLKGRTELLCGP